MGVIDDFLNSCGGGGWRLFDRLIIDYTQSVLVIVVLMGCGVAMYKRWCISNSVYNFCFCSCRMIINC